MSKVIIYYDNWCPLCIRVRKILTRLDICNHLTFLGIRNTILLPFPLSRMSREMFINISGNYYHGFTAFKELSKHLIMLIPLLPMLTIIAKIGLGDKVYRYVADKRKILPVGNCTENTCNLH